LVATRVLRRDPAGCMCYGDKYIVVNQTSFPWRGLLLLTVCAVLLAVGYRLATAWVNSPLPAEAAAPPLANTPRVPAPAKPPASDTEIREVTPAQLASATQLPAVLQATSRPAPAAIVAAQPPVRFEPSPYTRQLIANLTQIDMTGSPITKAQAEQWKQGYQTLVAQGDAAVPAIRQFLEQNQELTFSAVAGGELLGQPSLRTALISALQQIGGPDATAVMLDTLRSTTLPSEIALLAKYLDHQAPGQYRPEALNAAGEVLALAARGQLGNWDVGPLFQVIQNYGDAASAPALEQFQSTWQTYGAISLAQMQSGQGVAALVNQTRDPAGGAHEFTYEQTRVRTPPGRKSPPGWPVTNFKSARRHRRGRAALPSPGRRRIMSRWATRISTACR
jgi:hypothetical protein